MTLPGLDLSATRKPAQVQNNLIAYYRLFASLPGMVMVDTAESFYFISNVPAPGNMIFRTCWPVDACEERIDEIFGQIALQTDEIDWMVFPGDSPNDLSQRLERRGMPAARGGYWLWADLKAPGVTPSVPAGFHIEQVHDDASMARWVRISEEGFGEELGCFFDAYTGHGYGHEAFSLHYIGYLGDIPVTSGTLLDAGGCASIYDLSTPPDYRRQGYGSSLMRVLMEEIRKRGYQDTWIWSSQMGRSVYQKLGYVDVDFGLREHSWRKVWSSQ